jgi:chromosome segregation ATPase
MDTSGLTASEEHRRAARKHALLLNEIEQWKAEHARALDTLSRAERFVREHDALLDHHSELIAEHAKRLEEHEAAIAASSSGHQDPSLSKRHEELEELHQKVLEQHNRFRGRHPALVREITQLAVELHKVSHQPG